MSVLYKPLGHAAPAANTETDLYTVPANTSVVESSIVICNRGVPPTTCRVSHSWLGAATANTDYWYYDLLIPGQDTFIATIGATLQATDKVRIFANNSNLSFNLYGSEVT